MAKKKKSPNRYKPAIKEGHESEVPEDIGPLFLKMPILQHGYITPSSLEQPSELPAILNLGRNSRLFAKQIWDYLKTIFERGRTFESYDLFERGLAFDFAYIVWILNGFDREEHRVEFLHHFLRRLNLPNRRGRPEKSSTEMMVNLHGLKMMAMWREELQPAWHMKNSQERQGLDAEERLRKNQVEDDVIKAIMGKKATYKSSLARVYSERYNISFGTAKNALRKYLELNNKKLGAQV